MIKTYIKDEHENICPICNSDYSNFNCPKKEWKNGDCNCFLNNSLWRDYTIANIPNDYFSKDINDFEFINQCKDLNFYKNICKYANNIVQVYNAGFSLFLYNETQSVGKTFFAISILKEAYRKKYSIFYCPFVTIYNNISDKQNTSFLKELDKYDFLVIDGIDKQLNCSFLTDTKILNYFEEFLRKRFKPIIFTSNNKLKSDISTLKVIDKIMKTRIIEIFIDTKHQYNQVDSCWETIMNPKKEIIK